MLLSTPYQKLALCKEWAHSEYWFQRSMDLFGSNYRIILVSHTVLIMPEQAGCRKNTILVGVC